LYVPGQANPNPDSYASAYALLALSFREPMFSRVLLGCALAPGGSDFTNRRLHVDKFRSLAIQCVLRYLIEVSVYVVGTLALITVAFGLLRLAGVL